MSDTLTKGKLPSTQAAFHIGVYRRLGANNEPVFDAVKVERDDLFVEVVRARIVSSCHVCSRTWLVFRHHIAPHTQCGTRTEQHTQNLLEHPRLMRTEQLEMLAVARGARVGGNNAIKWVVPHAQTLQSQSHQIPL